MTEEFKIIRFSQIHDVLNFTVVSLNNNKTITFFLVDLSSPFSIFTQNASLSCFKMLCGLSHKTDHNLTAEKCQLLSFIFSL